MSRFPNHFEELEREWVIERVYANDHQRVHR